MPVDIQAQYVTLNIDIVAQTVGNIGIDIKAQTVGNINVNLAASDVTINVAVTGTANIQITAQTVGIYLQPEWAAKTGVDKDFDALSTDKPWLGSASGTYTVPAGKTLYITDCSFFIRPVNEYDASRPLYFIGYLYNDTTGATFARISGIGGAVKVFSKPGTIPENEVFAYAIYSTSMVKTDIAVHANGFEV